MGYIYIPRIFASSEGIYSQLSLFHVKDMVKEYTPIKILSDTKKHL